MIYIRTEKLWANGLFSGKWVLILIKISKLRELSLEVNPRIFNYTKVYQSTAQKHSSLKLELLEVFLEILQNSQESTCDRVYFIYFAWIYFRESKIMVFFEWTNSRECQKLLLRKLKTTYSFYKNVKCKTTFSVHKIVKICVITYWSYNIPKDINQ